VPICDTHPRTRPNREGQPPVGARLVIEAALSRAGIVAAQVDYVNLHGTATVQNDVMESRVIHALFGARVPVWCPARLTQLDRTSEIGARPKHLTVPNRCVRTRTHGGVGGRSREAASYPE
jgi:hypothetical protein